jgi:hypothetical protein
LTDKVDDETEVEKEDRNIHCTEEEENEQTQWKETSTLKFEIDDYIN